jgi:hypothetical protein
LTACEIDLNQNERSQGKLEELNGDIFFVAKNGQVYQQIKNSMVELPFYSQKQLTEKRSLRLTGLAYLPLDIILSGRSLVASFTTEQSPELATKTLQEKLSRKKIDASENCPRRCISCLVAKHC